MKGGNQKNKKNFKTKNTDLITFVKQRNGRNNWSVNIKPYTPIDRARDTHDPIHKRGYMCVAMYVW